MVRRNLAHGAPNGIDETAAKAHYSLGVLMASSGRGQEAIKHLSAAVGFSPNYVEAYQALADALRRSGRIEQSMTPVPKRSGSIPKQPTRDLVTAWRSSSWAATWKREIGSTRRHDFTPIVRIFHALSRVLAAAPDDRVRDGQRSQAITERLLQSGKTIDLGETMAMALAERGQFAEAVAIQRSLIQASIRSELGGVTKHLTANLLRYERQQPCRMPWASDDPIHSPGPAVDPGLLASVPASTSQ